MSYIQPWACVFVYVCACLCLWVEILMHRKTQGTSVEISPLCFNMPLKGNISVRNFVFVRNMANVQALKLVVSLPFFPSLQVTSLSWQQSFIWISQCRKNLQCSEVTTSGWSLLSLCFPTFRRGEKLKLRRITWYNQRILAQSFFSLTPSHHFTVELPVWLAAPIALKVLWGLVNRW